MHMSAIAYNLKKYLKFISKKVKSDAKSLTSIFNQIKVSIQGEISHFTEPEKLVNYPLFNK